MRALYAGHGPAHVSNVTHVADDDFGPGVAQRLGALVILSDQRPRLNHVGVMLRQSQDCGAAGVASGACDENARVGGHDVLLAEALASMDI